MHTLESLLLRQTLRAESTRDIDATIRLVDAVACWGRVSLLPEKHFESDEDKQECVRTYQADARRLERLLSDRIGAPVTISVQGLPPTTLAD